MPRSAVSDASIRCAAVPRHLPPAPVLAGIAAVVMVLVRPQPAAAQQCGAPVTSCQVPKLNLQLCENAGNSIDDYMSCYRDLFDCNAIPVFKTIALCSHPRAEGGLKAALEGVSSMVTGAISDSVSEIASVLPPAGPPIDCKNPTGPIAICICNLNALDDVLGPKIAAELNAPDRDAYRRTYTIDNFNFFTSEILAARQNRAACDGPMLTIRQKLVEFEGIKARHLDYCQLLRDNAKYADIATISNLADWTSIDPKVHYDAIFGATVTWNTQCGSFDFSNTGTTTIRYSPCAQATVEYQQTLSQLDGSVLGWIADHRAMVVTTSGAIGATIASWLGAGAGAAGIWGAVAATVVGVVISVAEWWELQSDIDDLKNMVASKEQELKDVVVANYITEDEFHGLVEQVCSGWKGVLDQRIQGMLEKLDPARHVQQIDDFYVLSDKLHNWYNALFLWATQPDAGGHRFLDDLAAQDLLRQVNDFDQRTFKARADQETAVQTNTLTNIKSKATLLSCSGIGPPQQRGVKTQLNFWIGQFNAKCNETMNALGVQPDLPIPVADANVTSDVVCAYTGFHNGLASLQIENGTGSSSNMTLRDASGAALAQFTGVTSATNFRTLSFPGFACSSPSGLAFGTSPGLQLAAGAYVLHLRENIFGFGAADADAMRTATQNQDSQLRFKAIACTRQLGTPNDIARTGDACGVPNVR